ncbi:MAG TPA: BatA domain-containing protein, partial [Candidatus Ozemobacteraceae bacterium]|nr:BatA domain-containing protein [Candidatus Ozemobacteraceae bacterium]
MLSFTSPWILTGLLTIGIPVYLHLYYRRTPVPRDFPSLRLIRQSVEQLYNRMQIRNWILLVLRCLVILFLVSAFARPFWGAGSGGPVQKGAPTAFVIALDTSMSMGASHQGISLFNAAKAKAIEILDRMGPYDKGAIAAIHDPGLLLSPQLTWDKNELKETVRNLPLSWAGTNLGSSLQPALKLLSQVRNTKRTLYVITDLTTQAWKPFTDTYDLKRIDKDIDLVLIPIGNEAPVNLSVSKLTCEAPVVIKGRSAPVAITVSNHSARSQKSVLSLYLDGEKKWETPVDLDARGSKRLLASCTFPQAGVSQIRATLTGDTLPQDDQRHLAVKVLTAPRILILHPPVDREGRETRDDLYLRFALAPLGRQEGATFLVERRLPEETNSLALEAFSAIFLVNQRQLSDALLKRLQDYLMGGGNLV